jgi:prevent-host-death family protein
MPTITAEDAERNFSQILKQVREGVEFTVTEGGEPVARVSSASARIDLPQGENREAEDIFRRIDEIGKRQRLRGLSIHQLIDEGRRF